MNWPFMLTNIFLALCAAYLVRWLWDDLLPERPLSYRQAFVLITVLAWCGGGI